MHESASTSIIISKTGDGIIVVTITAAIACGVTFTMKLVDGEFLEKKEKGSLEKNSFK